MVMELMKTLGQLIDGLEIIEARGAMDVPIAGICYDSRKAGPGSLFVCVRGSHVDGHRFIEDALSRGAVAIIAETGTSPGVMPPAYVRVPNSRGALAAVAANFYDHPASRLDLVGITGTNGKTTTSLLIESILRRAGREPGVLGTLAYRWAGREMPAPMTTPESLDLQKILHRMLEDGVSHVVMEVSSHALALGRVAGLIFRAGVFTNLSRDHLDFHQTMEDYFSAKKLLFSECLDLHRSAVAVNADDDYGKRILQNGVRGGRLLTYSAGPSILPPSKKGAEGVFAKEVRLGAGGIHALLSTPRGDLKIESPLVGRLNLYNLLAAVSASLGLDLPSEAIAEGIRAVSEVDGRLQRVEVPAGLGYHVIVDYAHTPDAMEKALDCLREMTPGRLIAVFGCGGDRDRGKRPQMGRIGAERSDLVIITSDNPRTEDPEKILDQVETGVRETKIPRFDPDDIPPERKCYARCADRRRAIELALSAARPGDLVFIGGKGHETYQIIGATKHPFDDRQVVREYLEGR